MHHDPNVVLEVENPIIWHLQHHMKSDLVKTGLLRARDRLID